LPIAAVSRLAFFSAVKSVRRCKAVIERELGTPTVRVRAPFAEPSARSMPAPRCCR